MQSPNILLIVCDQMTPFLTGAYGHPVVKTPNMDRLAREGVLFENAYSPCPVCAPARACMMSGTYTSVNGVFDNGAVLPSDMPTFAHYLTNAGYDTVLSGKMHFVGPDQLHGFRKRLTTDIYGCDFRWVKDAWIQIKESRGQNWQEIMGARTSFHSKGYIGDAVKVAEWHHHLSYDEETHLRSLEYLHAVGRDQNRQPFLLCASYHHPHDPFWPPQQYWDLYENEDIEIPEFPEDLEEKCSMMDNWLNSYHGVKENDLRDPDSLRRMRRAYYGLVTYIDDKIGELVASLDENGLTENTIVIFLSDHGDMLCEKEMVQKRTFYEWSSRVPFIIRIPDGTGAGTRAATPVSLIDLLPTLCDFAGVKDRMPCNGRSLLGLIDGSDREERVVFSETHSEAVGVPCFMVRKGKFKYIYIHGYEDQLFDLESDPGEWNNLSGNPDFSGREDELRELVLDNFDPDRIADEVLSSLRRRELIRETMNANKTFWDYAATFDPRKNSLEQYFH
ncbi:MAG: choline-sulfatase [Planctomycetota bacterium]|jgi:choline-sulfatase|nr:choline-sulfatase [Planctomycetota bacterium]